MMAFDTEDDSNGSVTIINFYDGHTHTTFTIDEYKTQLDLKKAAIKFIVATSEKKFASHNLEYDIINVFYPYFMKYLELMYTGRLITAKLLGTHKTFIDSFNFSFTSLKNIGSEIGLPKLDAGNDFYNIEYCRRDTQIVYKFLDDFKQLVYNKFDLPIKMTLAGTSQNIFLKKFCTEKINNKNKDIEILNAYYGGRCEVFRVGEIHDYIFAVDVNSMYPFVMQNFTYPTGKGFITQKPVSDFFIAHVKIKIKTDCYIPIIPYRTDKLLFPVGKFETWVTSVELKKAYSEGQVEAIEFIQTYNFLRPRKVFTEFVDFFYRMRFAAKEDGKKFESNFYKRLLNSVYGRFALKSEISFIGPYKKSSNWEELQNDLILSHKEFVKRNVNYAIPLFITAYSRVILYELFKKITSIGGKILYTDTDSVYFHYHKKINIEKKQLELQKVLPISNKLGDLSLDIYRAGSFRNAKAYLLEKFDGDKKIKLKGIPKQNREEFYTTGSTTYKRPMKLRPSLRSVQNIKANVWYDFYIESRGKYVKRRVSNNYKFFSDTRPIVI